MKHLLETINENKEVTIGFTSNEIESLLAGLSIVKHMSEKGELDLSSSEVKREFGPIYKKLFDAASDRTKNDKDFGNGDIMVSKFAEYL